MQHAVFLPSPVSAVRPAHDGDIAVLSTIWQAFMQLHAQCDKAFALAPQAVKKWQSMAREMIQRDDTFVLVATQQQQPCGFCMGWIARNPAIYAMSELGFISEIAVAVAAQRQGLGTALMAAAQAWFARHHLQEFQLSTAMWNHAAQKFWQALGGQPLLIRYRFPVSRA